MEDQILEIDLNSLRVREIEEIEERLGLPFDEVVKPGQPKAKMLRAIGYIVKKRENPDFTWEDAGELIIKLSEPDPTEAAG